AWFAGRRFAWWRRGARVDLRAAGAGQPAAKLRCPQGLHPDPRYCAAVRGGGYDAEPGCRSELCLVRPTREIGLMAVNADVAVVELFAAPLDRHAFISQAVRRNPLGAVAGIVC